MYFSDCSHLIDTVSSTQLMNAINKLEWLSPKVQNQMQLSFNKTNQKNFIAKNPQSEKINFEEYMAIKNKQNKTFNKQKNKENNLKCGLKIKQSEQKYLVLSNLKNSVQKKKKTPNKKNPCHHYTSMYQQDRESKPKAKNRSCSPIQINKSNQNKENISKIKKINKVREAQNTDLSKNEKTKILQTSKQILMKKQKNGNAYIPIQYRTNQLLKQKKEKLQKIQQEVMTCRQKQEKQCTFKPMINSYRKPRIQNQNKAEMKKTNNGTLQYLFCNISREESIQKTVEFTNQFNSIKTQIDENLQTLKQKHKKSELTETNKKKQKPLNPKYNTLLDFI